MTISIIANVTKYNDKLALGSNNELLHKIPEDLKFFKNITTNNENTLFKNVVVMGRKTWDSLPQRHRPLKDRLNIVLTNNKDLLDTNPTKFKFPIIYKFLKPEDFDKDVYFLNIDQFDILYNSLSLNIFVIGGGQIYKIFLKKYSPKYVYLTETTVDKHINTPDTFFEPLGEMYSLSMVSEKRYYGEITYIFKKYTLIY